MSVSIPDSHRPLLDQPIYASLGTIRPDDTVQVNPMWFEYDGEHLRFTHTNQRGKFQPWADDDLVYFGEDDYVYRPETFTALPHAAERLPHVDHFAPYATIGHTMPNGEPLHAGLKRPRRPPRELADIDDVTWHRATSHTVSFAIRVRALRADRTLHKLALKASGAWDHTMCLACQGIVPYTARELAEPLHAPTGASASRRAKIVIWRMVLSALALQRRRHRHVIAAPSPALASHMEVGLMAEHLDVHGVT